MIQDYHLQVCQIHFVHFKASFISFSLNSLMIVSLLLYVQILKWLINYIYWLRFLHLQYSTCSILQWSFFIIETILFSRFSSRRGNFKWWWIVNFDACEFFLMLFCTRLYTLVSNSIQLRQIWRICAEL